MKDWLNLMGVCLQVYMGTLLEILSYCMSMVKYAIYFRTLHIRKSPGSDKRFIHLFTLNCMNNFSGLSLFSSAPGRTHMVYLFFIHFFALVCQV